MNAAAPLVSRPALPRPGDPFRYAFASHLAVDDDDEALTLALLEATRAQARERSIPGVVVGLSEHDRRRLPVARQLRAMAYWSSLCTVAWPDCRRAVAALDDRAAHVEIAVL